MNTINFVNVSKDFGDYTSIFNMFLQLNGDKLYGIFGKDNSGKSTVTSILSGQLIPDAGEVLYNGNQLISDENLLKNICSSGENFLYPKYLKPINIFKIMIEMFPNFDLKYAEKLFKQFEISTHISMGKLSNENQVLASGLIALATKCDFIILDEPAGGISPEKRRLFYQTVKFQYEKEKKTIAIATNQISEFSEYVTDVIILNMGKVICNSPIEFFTKNGYSVKGNEYVVDDFISNKKIIGAVSDGDNKTAFLLGVRPLGSRHKLTFGKLSLELIFDELTNGKDANSIDENPKK